MPVAETEILSICSKCGYDLRGIESERCPECGFPLAQQTTLRGEIPWTYRRVRGRMRAFVQTVMQVTGGAPWIAGAIAAPVSLRDARRFWLVAATIISSPWIAAFVYVWIRRGDLQWLVYLPDPVEISSAISSWGWGGVSSTFDSHVPPRVRTELLWPLSAGLTRPGVAIAALWLFVLFGTGAPTYLFHPRRLGPSQRQRANAVSHYLCAPLVLTVPPAFVMVASVAHAAEFARTGLGASALLAALMVILIFVICLVWLFRLLVALRRTTQAEPHALVLAALLVPTMWVGSAAFALVFVPWCVGVAWLLVDALR